MSSLRSVLFVSTDFAVYSRSVYFISIHEYFVFRFLQCISYEIPPCDLLMLQDLTPAHKELASSGKLKHPSQLVYIEIIWIFETFLKTVNVCARAGHTQKLKCM